MISSKGAGGALSIVFSVLFVASLGAPLHALDSPCADPSESAETRSQATYHALLIGIDEYKPVADQGAALPGEWFGDLETPGNDVEGLKTGIEAQWGFDRSSIVACVGEQATHENILAELTRLGAELTPDDHLLVYFAGHGVIWPDEDGEAYLVPHDGRRASFEQEGLLVPPAQTWISSRQLVSQVEAIRAGHVLIVVDSCYSGFLARSAFSHGGSRSVAVLTSADDQEALDGVGLTHSPFADALITVLANWRAELPASRLADKVRTHFSAYRSQCAEERDSGDPSPFCAALARYGQEPQFRPASGAGHGGGEFVLRPVDPQGPGEPEAVETTRALCEDPGEEASRSESFEVCQSYCQESLPRHQARDEWEDRSEAGLPFPPAELARASGVARQEARRWVESWTREAALGRRNCREVAEAERDRCRAENRWRENPRISAEELAADHGVTAIVARGWIRQWKPSLAAREELDCKFYGDTGGAAGITQERFERQIARSPVESRACAGRLQACRYMIVDCLLPPRLRRLGRRLPAITPKRWVRTTAGVCKSRNGRFEPIDELAPLAVPARSQPAPEPGEAAPRPAGPFRVVIDYGGGVRREVAPVDRDPAPEAGRAAAQSVPSEPPRWEENGGERACAQNYLGEIYERRGHAVEGDPEAAAMLFRQAESWYRKAADQQYSKALVNLGSLYERGLGRTPDPLAALACYEAATGEKTLLAELAPPCDDSDRPDRPGAPRCLPAEVRQRILTRGGSVGERPRIEVTRPSLPARDAEYVAEAEKSQPLFLRVFGPFSIVSVDLNRDSIWGDCRQDGDGVSCDHEIELGEDREKFDLEARDEVGQFADFPFTLRPPN